MACYDAATPVRFVEALVVLPGWTVNYPKGASDRIRDPRNVAVFLEKQELRLDPHGIDRIAGWLEQRCRVLAFDEDGQK